MWTKKDQVEFDSTIGKLDRALSLMIYWAADGNGDVDTANEQTLKHHAEDMIGAGEKILRELGQQIT